MRATSDIRYLPLINLLFMKNEVSPRATIAKLRLRIKKLLVFFIIALVVSGLTAFPIESQLRLANECIHSFQRIAFKDWVQFIYQGVSQTSAISVHGLRH